MGAANPIYPRVSPGLRRAASGLVGIALLIAMIGCTRPAGVIFPPMDPPLVWPPAPDTPRIRYVGQLAFASDLKPAVDFGQALAEALLGKHDDRSMLTPFGVCTDGADRVFVADTNTQSIHVLNLNTRAFDQWLLPENGKPHTRRFGQPVAVSFDPLEKKLFVSDSVDATIYVFNSDGSFAADLQAAEFQRPTGIAFDPQSRRLFVADTKAHQVVVLSPHGQVLTRIGTRGDALGQFNYPTAVTVDRAGMIYVCDSLNWRVQVLDPALKPLRSIGSKGDSPGYFSQPKGLASDSAGHLYVLDAHFEAVQIFDREGTLLLSFGEEGREPGQFWLPTGIFIDLKNRIWVADSYNRRIQVFDYLPQPDAAPAGAPASETPLRKEVQR